MSAVISIVWYCRFSYYYSDIFEEGEGVSVEFIVKSLEFSVFIEETEEKFKKVLEEKIYFINYFEKKLKVFFLYSVEKKEKSSYYYLISDKKDKGYFFGILVKRDKVLFFVIFSKKIKVVLGEV